MTHTSYDSARGLRELDRQLGRARVGAGSSRAGDADQRGVVGVVGQGCGIRLELLEELAEPLVDDMRVDRSPRACRVAQRGSGAPPGGMNTVMSQTSNALGAAEVGELAQALLQLGEGRHGGDSTAETSTARCVARRGRRYTRAVADESPELFDDIYLGLRAGGAARKQRRGEPLSVEEKEAIGRWQRLSLWRRFIAIGAFALGTFGLGFTVGGLVFGRWRKA